MLPLWTDGDSGVRVVRLTDLEEIETLVQLFETIAIAENWQPEGALRLWIAGSVYFALEVKGELAGGLQLVLPDMQGRLPYHTVWPEVAVPSAMASAHVAILALDEDFRGKRRLFWPLTAEMWRYCIGERINSLFMEVTPRVRPVYQRIGWPLRVEGQLREHWGEDCYLCTLGIPEVAETLLRRSEQSLFYQEIVAQMIRVTLSKNERTIGGQENTQVAARSL